MRVGHRVGGGPTWRVHRLAGGHSAWTESWGMSPSQQINAKSTFQAERTASAQIGEGKLKSCHAFLFSNPWTQPFYFFFFNTTILEARIGIPAKYRPCFPSKVPPIMYRRGLLAKLPHVSHCHAVGLLIALCSEYLELLFLRTGRGKRSGEVISLPWVRSMSSSLPNCRSSEAGILERTFPHGKGG